MNRAKQSNAAVCVTVENVDRHVEFRSGMIETVQLTYNFVP